MEKQFYNIVNKGKNAEIRIYGDIWYYGEGSSKNLSKQLNQLSKNHEEITLKINSGGGSVIEAVAIYNIIKNTDAKVIAIIEGIAASAMSFIIMACDKVIMGKATRIMTHKLRGGGYGTSQLLRNQADMMDSWEEDIYEMYASKTGMTVAEVKKTFFIEGKDVWLSPNDALKHGLIDEIQKGGAVKEGAVKGVVKAELDNSISNVHDAWQHYETQINNNIIKHNKMKKVIEKLGLPENATEAEVLTAIESIEKSKVIKGELLELPDADKSELANRLEKLENQRSEELVNAAILAGKIVAKDKDVWLNIAKNDYDQTKGAIDSLPGKLDVKALINQQNNGGVEDRSKWDIEDYLKNAPEALAEMEDNDPKAYKALIDKSYS